MSVIIERFTDAKITRKHLVVDVIFFSNFISDFYTNEYSNKLMYLNLKKRIISVTKFIGKYYQ